MELKDQYEIIAASLAGIVKLMRHGCGNHGCRINPPKGQGTNGPCMCTPRTLSRLLLHLASMVEDCGTKKNIEQKEG